ncbi:MAG TPA: hypothetical protein VIG25_24190, partial [Pyrinomonadaceae bacterium]
SNGVVESWSRELCTKSENPTHGSGWMRSSPFYKTKLPEYIEIPHTAVRGSFKSELFICFSATLLRFSS